MFAGNSVGGNSSIVISSSSISISSSSSSSISMMSISRSGFPVLTTMSWESALVRNIPKERAELVPVVGQVPSHVKSHGMELWSYRREIKAMCDCVCPVGRKICTF